MEIKKTSKQEIFNLLMNKDTNNNVVVLFPDSRQKRIVSEEIGNMIRNDAQFVVMNSRAFKATSGMIRVNDNFVYFGLIKDKELLPDLQDILEYEETNITKT